MDCHEFGPKDFRFDFMRVRGHRRLFCRQSAQAFNLFYHRHRILTEMDAARRTFLLRLSRLVERQLVAALDLLGIEAPEKM